MKNRVSLRHVVKTDIRDITNYISNVQVAKFLSWSAYKNQKDIEKYLLYATKAKKFPDEILSIIYNDNVIGTAHLLYRGDLYTQIGFGILPDYWNRGLGSEIFTLLIDFFIKSTWSKQSRHLYTVIHKKNIYAQKIALKNDFHVDAKYKNKNKIKYVRTFVEVPTPLETAYRKGLLEGVILFGSSLYKHQVKDIDLLVITKKDAFFKFTEYIKNKKINCLYDISLIKSEEIKKDNFFFGSHGIYIAEAFKNGIVILGQNPFLNLRSIKPGRMRRAVFERMKEYIYLLRKKYFQNKIDLIFLHRYYKFLKLSIYLINKETKLLEIIRIDKRDLKNKIELTLDMKLTNDIFKNMEIIWKKINDQY